MDVKKRALFLTTKYPLASDSSWLSADLAENLVRSGWGVTVLFLDWDSSGVNKPKRVFRKNGVVVLRHQPVTLPFFRDSKSVKWMFTSVTAYFSFFKIINRISYDALIAFSPVVTVWFLLLALSKKVQRSALLYWDFFPIHQIQIGLISDGISSKALFLVEKYLVSKFSFVGCMSQRNVDFFIRYFSFHDKKIHEVPLWGSYPVPVIGFPMLFDHPDSDADSDSDPDPDLGSDVVRCIFGGQLVAGRGVSFLARLIARIAEERLPISLTVIGSGAEEHIIDAAIQSSRGTAIRIPLIPRNDYLSRLRQFDVGLIVTVSGVTVPTYPSKIIDYSSVGLPVVAAVEVYSDFPDYVELYGAGVCVEVDNLDAFISSILRFKDVPFRMSCSVGALEMFRKRHSQEQALGSLNDFLKVKII